MDRSLAVAVAGCGVVRVSGTFYRHVSPSVRELTGTDAGGRWGPAGAYSVLYLGRPPESVVVEAHRHLVEAVEGMTPDRVRPRRLLTADVSVSEILDLRVSGNRAAVGLRDEDIATAPGDYAACQRVGSVAHQLGLHGIIATAATGVGETLAIFELHLPTSEQPILVEESIWNELPPDPRALRLAP